MQVFINSKVIVLLVSVILNFVVLSSYGDYVAYSIKDTGDKVPLPEEINSIEAKQLINIEWGKYQGRKSRISVLPVENKTPISSVQVKNSRGTVAEFNASTAGIPIDGIEAIISDVLHQTGRFRIVERQVLSEVLKEQDFGNSGRVSKPSMAKTGKVLGAEYQIQAVITNYEPDFKGRNIGIGGLAGGTKFGGLLGGVGIKSKKSMVGLNFRLIDATTSEIAFSKQVESVISESGLKFGGVGGGAGGGKIGILGGALSSYAKAPIGQAVIAGINKGVYAFIKEIGLSPATGSIVKVSGNKVYINIGASSVSIGDTLKVMSKGEELIDPETGISLGSEEEFLGTLKVIAVKDKFSIAKPLDVEVTQISSGDQVTSTSIPKNFEFGEPWKKKRKKMFGK